MYLDGLDELDQKIIQLLIENARISYSDIGKETGISRVAVKARIQALEKQGIIEEYTTIINPQKISGAVSCYFEIETRPDHLSQVTDILHNNDTVTQIYRVTGRDKLHVHAVASSSDEMERFLHTVIDTLPGVISCSCNTIVLKILKDYGYRVLHKRDDKTRCKHNANFHCDVINLYVTGAFCSAFIQKTIEVKRNGNKQRDPSLCNQIL